MSERPIVVHHVDHFFGEGDLRRQVLVDVSAEIDAGEIVILTGPSGSGKTTLLTLIGALRSSQSGSLRVLGHELHAADEARLAEVRRRIGYVFQAHNLLEALTARQNIRMSLELDPRLDGAEIERRIDSALEAVGLAERGEAHPSQLSGGQRQRVAIARALARRPEIVLADEPTASLDRETGRGIVELLERLARQERVSVVLVTHDNRILDVADRILTLEDGRLRSLMSSVAGGTRRMLQLLGQHIRRGELVARVEALDADAFGELLREVTEETRRLLDLVDLVQGDTFESMLAQVVQAFTRKTADLLGAEAASLRFADEAGGLPQLALAPTDLTLPGRRPGAHLTLPVTGSQGNPLGVVEVSGPRGREHFGESDERRLRELTASLGLILESWWRMSCACRAAGGGRTCPCCGASWHHPSPSQGSETSAL
jgi:putative ABC transport system ATP-binding protein